MPFLVAVWNLNGLLERLVAWLQVLLETEETLLLFPGGFLANNTFFSQFCLARFQFLI